MENISFKEVLRQIINDLRFKQYTINGGTKFVIEELIYPRNKVHLVEILYYGQYLGEKIYSEDTTSYYEFESQLTLWYNQRFKAGVRFFDIGNELLLDSRETEVKIVNFYYKDLI